MASMYRQQREEAARFEAPILRQTWLHAVINCAKGSPTPTEDDYRVFRVTEDDAGEKDTGLTPDAAAAAMDLINKGQCPPYVLGLWQQIRDEHAARPVKVRFPRALIDRIEEPSVIVIAPHFAEDGIRGMVGCQGGTSGSVLLRDIDRPLLTYRVTFPNRGNAGYVEAGLFLPLET